MRLLWEIIFEFANNRQRGAERTVVKSKIQ